MRTVVTVLNVISTLASLGMVWFGWVMAGFAVEFNPLHRDYYGLAYSIVVMAAFLIIPAPFTAPASSVLWHLLAPGTSNRR